MKNRVTNFSSMKWTFKEGVFLFCKYFSKYYLVTTGMIILVISAHFTLINATDFFIFCVHWTICNEVIFVILLSGKLSEATRCLVSKHKKKQSRVGFFAFQFPATETGYTCLLRLVIGSRCCLSRCTCIWRNKRDFGGQLPFEPCVWKN